MMEKEQEDKLENLLHKVNGSDISTIKSVVTSIIRIINDPDSTVGDIEEIIQVDPPLTARVLKVANSAYYSPQNKISEIDQAVIWLGFNALKELVLSQKVCEIFKRNDVYDGYSRPMLWRHCFAVALMGKMIYRREYGERGENAYVAGLLHDIGIIAIDQFLQQDFKRVIKLANDNSINLMQAENEVWGFTHQDVGLRITDNWGLPEEYVMAIGFHHKPDRVVEKFSKISCTLYVANYFCQSQKIGYGDEPFPDDELYKSCMKKLNLNPIALGLIAKNMQNEIRKMEEMGIF
ncbi:MAG TPA: HDOD domain-containing protein [bacterium]|nr:HDOD domain-containing protein [bacterium]